MQEFKGTIPEGGVDAAETGTTRAPGEPSNAPYPLFLLRTGFERPDQGRATEKCDEVTPSHCLAPRLRTGHRTAGTYPLEG
jgi:hypothetical protein